MAKDVLSVLLVDDSDDDRLFVRRALRKNPAFRVVAELVDGEEAISYLAGEGQFANRDKYPYPDVLFLDLKLPKKTGHEVLEWMNAEAARKLQVIVLSGSYLPQDVTRSRELGALAHFKKEALQDEQQATVAAIEKLLKSKL